MSGPVLHLDDRHLVLDAHPELGNNALLAAQLGFKRRQPFLVRDGEAIGCVADSRLARSDLRRRLEALYPRVVAIECGTSRPRRIAFCSGAGNSAVPELGAAGADTLVTGELREEWFNRAQEEKLNLYCCGHYATEVHAVQALAAHPLASHAADLGVDAARVAANQQFGQCAADDRHQRPACRCARSMDMGTYNSCPFRCAYCYANSSAAMIERNCRRQTPDSPALLP